jgi:hypothetical protein
MANLAGTGRALGVLQSNLTDIDAIGMNSGGKAGFYGATPVAQRAASTQATSLVSGISTGAVSTNSLLLASVLEIMSTLQAVGLWKGAA